MTSMATSEPTTGMIGKLTGCGGPNGLAAPPAPSLRIQKYFVPRLIRKSGLQSPSQSTAVVEPRDLNLCTSVMDSTFGSLPNLPRLAKNHWPSVSLSTQAELLIFHER